MAKPIEIAEMKAQSINKMYKIPEILMFKIIEATQEKKITFLCLSNLCSNCHIFNPLTTYLI